MNILAIPTLYTPDDLLRMPDSKSFELVDGHLVERNMGMESSEVIVLLGRKLGNHCEPLRLGRIFDGEAGYQCFPDAPNRVRKPDVSFVALERMPVTPKGWATVAPDMAAEVLSPNDLACEVDSKVDEYRAAGVRLVWVINPERHIVYVHRLTGPGAILRDGDELTGEDVIPGFRCPVRELFPTL